MRKRLAAQNVAEAMEAARRGWTLGASADRADGSAERVGSRRAKRQEAKFTPLLPISWREGAGGKSRSLVLEVKFKVLDIHAELLLASSWMYGSGGHRRGLGCK